jgi:hypothetical protein
MKLCNEERYVLVTLEKLLYPEHLITDLSEPLLKIFHLITTDARSCTQSKEQNLGLQTKRLVPKPLIFCQIIASRIFLTLCG